MAKDEVYLASGFFCPQQLADLEAMKAACTAADLSYYSPKDEVVCSADAPANFAAFVLKSNEDAIRASGRVFANLRHKDLSTSFEVGLAAALSKSVRFYDGVAPEVELRSSISLAATTLFDLRNQGYYSSLIQDLYVGGDVWVVPTAGNPIDKVVAAGWLHAKGCRVIYYCEGLPPGAAVNLMLAATAISVATEADDLAYCIEQAQADPTWARPYTGRPTE